MKKYTSLVLSLIALTLNILCFWFMDVLFNRVFVLVFIPLAFVLLLLIVTVIINFVLLFREFNVVMSYIRVGISLITILMILFFPFRMARVRTEFWLFGNRRDQVVEMVCNGQIIPDSIGNAELPAGYRATSSDGTIHVYLNNEEQVICFWVFRGMLSGSVELVYSSRGESLIYDNIIGVYSITEMKDHWYLVETEY